MFKTKSSKFIGLLSIACIAVASGAAFTASNTFASAPVAGYGAEAVTGATVTDTAITPLAADPSQVSAVIFTTSTDIMTETSTLTFSNTVAGNEAVVAVYACTPAAIGSGVWTISCDTTAQAINTTFSDDPTFAGFDQIGLTVSAN
jgi:hypothetical protein